MTEERRLAGRRGRARVATLAFTAAVAAVTAACGGGGGGGSGPAADPLAVPPTLRPPGVSFALPEQLGSAANPALTDASGLAASRATPGNLWSHNDSDAPAGPLLFCLGFQGADCGVARLGGVEAVDWEDVAVGPGPRPGVHYLYVGDIGDEGGRRPHIVVYRFPEPVLPADPLPTATDPFVVEGVEALRLRYPDGPRHAEALMVHPVSGDLYLMTKDASRTQVYVARAPLDPAAEAVLAHVVDLDVGFVNPRSRQVTAADISPDGRHVGFITYAEGYELTLPAGAASFDEIWRQQPLPIHLPDRLLGESVTYRLDSRALITTNETRPANLHQMERREPRPS